MSLAEQLEKQPRSHIAKALARASSTLARYEREEADMLDKVGKVGGAVTAALGGAGVGFISTRWPNEDGTPLSLGPVPLPALVGAVFEIGAVLPLPEMVATQLAFMAAGQFGSAGHILGLGWGAKARAEAGTSGYDEEVGWTPEEAALLGE